MAAPRVWLRWLPFPIEREELPAPEPAPGITGRDGIVRGGDYLRRSMGLPAAHRYPDEDQGVTWTPWPPPS